MNIKPMLTWFRGLPATTYLASLLVASLVTGIAGFIHYERTVGARDATIAQTQPVIDSLHAQAKAQAQATARAQAQVRKDSLAALKARQATAQASARADVAVADATAARERARRLAEDSAATIPALKAELLSLATKTEQADAAHATERSAWQTERATAAKDLASVKAELETTKTERNTANGLNAQLTKQVAALTGDRPGVIRTYVVPALAAGGGYWLGSRTQMSR